MTRDEALELIERMAFIPTLDAPDRKTLLAVYEASVASDDPLDWVKVVKSCHTRKHFGGPSLTGAEERCGDAAKQKLERELGKALGLAEDAVEAYIRDYIAENV